MNIFDLAELPLHSGLRREGCSHDEDALQQIVHEALTDGGFDLTTVASGQEAVTMLESGVVKYSALVKDINLNGSMLGWEVASFARQIDRKRSAEARRIVCAES